MTRTTNSLTLASLIALLSATPTVAFSGSTDCTPSDPVALRACFRSAEFNVIDDLDVYTRDLSAYRDSRTTHSARQKAPVAAEPSNRSPVHASTGPTLDSATLRAFFHDNAFNKGDDLTVYGQDFTSVGPLHTISHAPKLAQLPR